MMVGSLNLTPAWERNSTSGLSASYLEPDRYDEEEEGESPSAWLPLKTSIQRGHSVSLSRNEISSFQGRGIHLCVQYAVNAIGHFIFKESVLMSEMFQGLKS